MRINAYVMASEVPWLKESLLSYYNVVDKIIVSHDVDALSWTGRPLDIDRVLRVISSIDIDQKVQVITGNFHKLANPLDNDTFQRNVSLNHAAVGADWVFQIDTDEIVTNITKVLEKLSKADQLSATELWFPALWVYNQSRLFNIVYSDRMLRPVGGYPGPIAVKPGTRLECARQSTSRRNAYVVGIKRCCPIESQLTVDYDSKISDWILHMSWVRDPSYFDEKARNSGHAHEFDWLGQKRRWSFAKRFPILHCAMTPFCRKFENYSRHTLMLRSK